MLRFMRISALFGLVNTKHGVLGASSASGASGASGKIQLSCRNSLPLTACYAQN